MFNKLCNRKGYSLIELIIVIGLVGIVSVPLFMTFTTGLTIFESETSSNSDVDELRRFQLKFNEFIRSSTIGDVKLKNSALLINNKTYSLKNDSIISTDETSSIEVILLNNVVSYQVKNTKEINGNLTYFELAITINDHDRTFRSETSYKIRGDY